MGFEGSRGILLGSSGEPSRHGAAATSQYETAKVSVNPLEPSDGMERAHSAEPAAVLRPTGAWALRRRSAHAAVTSLAKAAWLC